MRRRLFSILGAAGGRVPLGRARLGRSAYRERVGHIQGSVFDSCTGEVVDDYGRVHTVLTDGISHYNVHLEAIGETSGVAYVGNNTINAPVHVAAGRHEHGGPTSPHQSREHGQLAQRACSTIRLQQVFDSSGNLISETSDFSLTVGAADANG